MGVNVLGVLAGGDMSTSLLQRWVLGASVVLAADAGADRLRAAGLTPSAIIGDMDSLSDMAYWRGLERDGSVRLAANSDQETTDCDKLLSFAEQEGHRSITLIGAEGDRLDHVLATVHSAARATIDVRFALRSGVAWVLNSGDRFRLPGVAGRTLSLVPIVACEGVSLSGVRWPLVDSALSPLGGTSISNRVSGPEVEARIRSGAMLLVMALPEGEAPLW